MYQAKSGVKKFSLYWGGGPSTKQFFFQSEHVSSQIWCQNIFPLLGGVPRKKNFFSSLNMYQAKSSVRKIFPLLGGVPRKKNFFSSPEHVSSQIWCQKIFPLLGGGSLEKKNFFSSLNIYQAKSGVKKCSLYFGGKGPSTTIFFFPVWTCIKPNLVSKNFSLY